LLSALSRLLSIITFFIAAGILSNLFKDYHLGDHGDSESFFSIPTMRSHASLRCISSFPCFPSSFGQRWL
jgi:hypothetical protein